MNPGEPPHLVYKELGTGRPVIVVPWGPGSFGSLYPWCMQPLAESNRLIHWDYRGCGESSAGDRYSLQDDAWDLAGLITTLQLEKPVLLGHSYGGVVALQLALDEPDLLGGLILVNTLASSTGLLEAQARRKAHMGIATFQKWQRLGLRAIAGEASDAEKLQYLELEARNWFEDERRVAIILRRLRLNFEVLAAAQPSLQAFDLAPRLSELRLPTLITAGHRDLIAAGKPRDLHLAVKHSRFHRFLESGHFPFLDQPAEFFRVVRSWLGELP